MIHDAYVVCGLGFGDEGKGSIVDYLVHTRNARLVIRYNGGAQAAHHVVLPDGRWHCFSQFGSGTFVPGVRTFLSKEMIIDPLSLIEEARVLARKGITDPFSRIFIDSRCTITTPFHKMLGRIKEVARATNRIGSTGMGIGEVVADKKKGASEILTLSDCARSSILRKKLPAIMDVKLKEASEICHQTDDKEAHDLYHFFTEKYNVCSLSQEYTDFVSVHSESICDGEVFLTRFFSNHKNIPGTEAIVLEGAQGVLLDPKVGTSPFVTKTPSTFKAAEHVLDLFPDSILVHKLGVIRAYAHRHGAGPLPTEDETLTAALPETHNRFNKWQEGFRAGFFDLPALTYALAVAGDADSIAVTSLDRVDNSFGLRVCSDYDYNGQNAQSLKKYFTLRLKEDTSPIITSWKNNELTTQELVERSSILCECTAYEYVEYRRENPGEETHPDKCTSTYSTRASNPLCMTDKARIEFIEFLESSSGLNLPVSIISLGSTWKDKNKIHARCAAL